VSSLGGGAWLYKPMCYSVNLQYCVMGHADGPLKPGATRPITLPIVDSALGWATGWTIGVLGFDSRKGLGIFLFATAMSRTALGPTQLPIQWVPGALSLEVKRP
jgi:hypothetical protein